MTLVWSQSKQNGNKLLTLLALADWSDPDGESWPGIKALAKKVRLSERGVQKILRELEETGEILISPNAGKSGTNRYVLSAIYQEGGVNWGSPGGCTTVHQGGERGFTRGVNGGSPNTLKDTSVEPSVEPADLFVEEIPEELKENWELWKQHLREKKVRHTPLAAKLQLRKLASMGASRANDAIVHSIANGYRGIYEPRQNDHQTKRARELAELANRDYSKF